MIDAWTALAAIFAGDATLVALLASDAHGDPAIYPQFREDLTAATDFPMITTPGASGENRLNVNQGDVEISTWVTVLDSVEDPEGRRNAIDERMVALADATIRSAHFYGSTRVSVRCVGMRDANAEGLLRRRRMWSVGVG